MDLIDNSYLKPYYKHIIASAKNKLEDDGVFTVLDTVVDGFTVKSDWRGILASGKNIAWRTLRPCYLRRRISNP